MNVVIVALQSLLVCIPDLLITRMFEAMKPALSKNELRYLMKKLKFPNEKIVELEQMYHGKDRLPDRVMAAMLFWKEAYSEKATSDELIRVLHVVGHEQLSKQLWNMKIMSQRLRL